MKRRTAALVHRWFGVGLGVLPVIFGISGAALLYRANLDAFLDPAVHLRERCTAVQPWSRQIAAARTALGAMPDEAEVVGDGQPGFISADATNPYAGREAFVQPCSARVSGVRERMRTVTGFALAVHDSLLAGKSGAVVVCASGIAVVLFLGTGAILWPGWRRLEFGFSVRPRARSYLRAYDLHKVAGIIMVPFLLITAFSGAVMSQYEASAAFLARVFDEPPRPNTSYAAPSVSVAGIDNGIDAALRRFANSQVVFLSFPTRADSRIEIDLRRPFEDDQFGATLVHSDGRTGRIIDVTDSRHAPASYTIMKAMLPYHMGTVSGLDLRLWYIAVALTPILLFATGLVVRFVRWSAEQRARCVRRLLSRSVRD